MGNIVDGLYEKFILRDVLSFITPGAILVITVNSALNITDNAMDIRNHMLHTLMSSIPSVLTIIIIYGVLFVVGFTLQTLGEVVGIIRFHDYRNDAGSIDNGEFYRVKGKFMGPGMKEAARQRERFVVLKQLSGNNAMAILLSAVALLVKLVPSDNDNEVTSLLLVVVGLLVVSGILFKAHWIHSQRQRDWEDTYGLVVLRSGYYRSKS